MTVKRSERNIGRFLVILLFLASALERLKNSKGHLQCVYYNVTDHLNDTKTNIQIQEMTSVSETTARPRNQNTSRIPD